MKRSWTKKQSRKKGRKNEEVEQYYWTSIGGV
jgi:hypothetical protein